MAITRRGDPKPPLSDECAAVLLGGWSARPPGGERPGDSSLFDLFAARDEGIVQLWREHEEYLRERAMAWGIEPAYPKRGTRVFFGEWLAVPWPEREMAS
jgi:hypothetical protein